MRPFFLAVFFILITAFFVGQITYIASHSGEYVSSVLQPPTAASTSGEAVTKFPKLTGRIVDNAGLLSSAQRESLEAKLAAFETKSSDQVVVATIWTLGGNNLEQYTNELFRAWELGQAEENNGVLLLIARNDRKMRIEVGYGIEGTLTDALSKTIIDRVIVPKFKSGNFGAGIVEGTDMIIAVLSGDTAELEARKKRNPSSQSKTFDWFFWIFLFFWATLFFGPLALAILAPIFGKKLGKHRYRWLGIEIDTLPKARSRRSGSGWSGGSSGGWSGGSSGGGFSGGGGSSGGGGASGSW